MIQIDGSHGEGGGSIARVALALATTIQKSVEITDIRSGRPQPGLKNQHLFCVKALEQLCNAKTDHAELGSTKLNYTPGKIVGGEFNIDIQTAGSISLFTQAILMPSLFANKKTLFNITGGTDAKWAAPIDYFKEIFLPHIQKFSPVECKTINRGFFPKGQGQVQLTIKPQHAISKYPSFEELRNELKKTISKINLIEQGTLVQIKGISYASSDLEKAQVAERQSKAAEVELSKLNCQVNIKIEYSKTASTGSGIVLYAIFSKNDEIDLNNPVRLGASYLGEKGKKAETVGVEAAKNLTKEINSGACVDKHLADQLIPYMALLPGSKIRTSEITDHTKSNIEATEQFLGKTFVINHQNSIISTIIQ